MKLLSFICNFLHIEKVQNVALVIAGDFTLQPSSLLAIPKIMSGKRI